MHILLYVTPSRSISYYWLSQVGKLILKNKNQVDNIPLSPPLCTENSSSQARQGDLSQAVDESVSNNMASNFFTWLKWFLTAWYNYKNCIISHRLKVNWTMLHCNSLEGKRQEERRRRVNWKLKKVCTLK